MRDPPLVIHCALVGLDPETACWIFERRIVSVPDWVGRQVPVLRRLFFLFVEAVHWIPAEGLPVDVFHTRLIQECCHWFQIGDALGVKL